MCNLTKEFKLCSCDGDKLSSDEIGWILRRKNESKEIEKIMGKPAIYRLTTKEQETKTAIAKELNTKNCFDFDYTPQEDDFLKIRLETPKGQWYAFRFLKGAWTEDTSTNFDHWRLQLDPFGDGKIIIQ